MRALAPLTLVALAGLAGAQTIHEVSVNGFSYTPANITIDVGDSVRWTWGLGLHDVESGTGGVPDFIFDSGNPELAPKTFEITFSDAFVTANPVAGDVYNYYCSIHVSFSMEGSVKVNVPPKITPYGCINPAGSLVALAGTPTVGTTWSVGVSNPIPGGQPAGSLAFLAVASAPQAGFPCGIPLPGWSMDPASPAGELLINIAPPNPLLSLGPQPWFGPPAAFNIPLPSNPSLVGATIYLQGLMFDITGFNTFGAGEGWQVVID